MKLPVMLLLMLFAGDLFAQNAVKPEAMVTGKMADKVVLEFIEKIPKGQKTSKLVIVVNDKVADTAALKLKDPDDIAWVDMIENLENTDKHIAPDQHTILLYTKDYVGEVNKKKIIRHSATYNEYVKHKPKARILYMLNDRELILNESQRLFKLPDEAFQSVTLEPSKGKNPATVKITTVPQN